MTENMTETGTAPATEPGAEPPQADAAVQSPAAESGFTPETEDLLEALRDVMDPELEVNVVDLGLVYGITMSEDKVATIDMTLTSAACPLTDVIEDQAKVALVTCGSTGCGCRRGDRTRSPRMAASSCARWASTSDPRRWWSPTCYTYPV